MIIEHGRWLNCHNSSWLTEFKDEDEEIDKALAVAKHGNDH